MSLIRFSPRKRIANDGGESSRPNGRKADDAWRVAFAHLHNRDTEEAITDLLADLQHLCQREKVDFEACLRMSREHYQAEA